MFLAGIGLYNFGVIRLIHVARQFESSSGGIEFRRRVVAATACQTRLPCITGNRLDGGWIQCGKGNQDQDRNCHEQDKRDFLHLNSPFIACFSVLSAECRESEPSPILQSASGPRSASQLPDSYECARLVSLKFPSKMGPILPGSRLVRRMTNHNEV